MGNILRVIGMLFLITQAGAAQNPADISFTLSTKNGQTTFRQGEAIPVELRIQSSAPGRYQAIIDLSQRANLNGTRVYDQFTGAPAAYAVDPLREQTRAFEVMTGGSPRMAPVTASPLILDQILNDWISFRKVGLYRISAQTQRVSLVDRSQDEARTFMPKALPLQSNTIEIEVVAAEDGWADAQLQRAVSVLSRAPAVDAPRAIDMPGDQEVVAAARVLRFIETREAALAMVRFFNRGPGSAQRDLQAGLYGSPYRNEVIAALKDGLTAPDAPVTSTWIETIAELTTAQALGPCPPPEKNDPAIRPWLDRLRAETDRCMEILSGAVAAKQGRARAVSVDVLARRNGAQPAPGNAIAAVLENFNELPATTQQQYLTQDWYKIASPAIVPLVRSLAVGKGPVRDTALIRLQELDPAGARPIVLDRIRKGDLSGSLDANRNEQALLRLPDRVLPEMDQPLVDLLEQGKPVQTLVCRYVSDAMFGRIRIWVEAHPYSICSPGNSVLPYLFRVDPAYTADLLARSRNSQPGSCMLPRVPSGDSFLSPGLEKAAIADLASTNPQIQRSALDLLATGGSAAAEQAIWDGLARLREKGNTPDNSGLEYGYENALTRGLGWILTPEKLERWAAACITDACRRNAEMQRHIMDPIPISVVGMPNDLFSVRIGQYQVSGVRQMDAKIRQFARGTKFYFPSAYKGVWYYEQRMSEIRRILDAAGMLIVDPPAR